jgi:hypothetical protein
MTPDRALVELKAKLFNDYQIEVERVAGSRQKVLVAKH